MNINSVDFRIVMNTNNTQPTSQKNFEPQTDNISTNAQIQKIVSQMQSKVDSMNISLQYSMYGENDNKVSVKVINKETGDLIREIPPKEIQELQKKIGELVGMIFNKKV